MDLKDKIIKALADSIVIQYVRLEDDDGISGFVVSSQFQDMSSLDRQVLIENALTKSSTPLAPAEKPRVLMIAGITPEEYEAVGTRIRIQKVEELAGGRVEILLHGGPPDAEYVLGAFKDQKGISTDEPKQVPGAVGVLMSFQAKGTEATPLTKAKAIRILKSDRYIELMTNA